MTVPAHAQETVYSFDIPAQDLGGALRAFGQATNQQIIFADDVVHGKRSGAVSGRHSADDALRQLLAGTALVARKTRGGKIGRASCRERVSQYVEIPVVAVSLKKKKCE